ncbi:MAG: hypothetical protein FWF82_04560 [Oscillospiraceae bacterium]|nr:hypothetical protein [Oscillospiraceae bacterium]
MKKIVSIISAVALVTVFTVSSNALPGENPPVEPDGGGFAEMTPSMPTTETPPETTAAVTAQTPAVSKSTLPPKSEISRDSEPATESPASSDTGVASDTGETNESEQHEVCTGCWYYVESCICTPTSSDSDDSTSAPETSETDDPDEQVERTTPTAAATPAPETSNQYGSRTIPTGESAPADIYNNTDESETESTTAATTESDDLAAGLENSGNSGSTGGIPPLPLYIFTGVFVGGIGAAAFFIARNMKLERIYRY